MNRVEDLFEVTMETPFGKTVTLRRSGMNKKDWDYICHKFGVTQYPSERVVSIRVDGHDYFEKLVITATVEKEKRDVFTDYVDELY